MLLVVGASGAGKSSLLRAGLVPALESAGLPDVPESWTWPKVVLTPGTHPLLALARQLAAHTDETPDQLGSRLRDDPAELRATVETVLTRHISHEHRARVAERRLLIIVDQFEEVFTNCDDDHERRIFLDGLTEVAPSVALVILGLRADFYARCAEEPQLADALQQSQLLVTPMKADELRAAIEEPAHKAGLRLEPGLVERILQDLGASRNEDQRRKSSGLPLLSYVLFETWRRRQGELLTLAGYEATGGVWEAVSQGAEQCHSRLTKNQREIAQKILLRMIRLGEAGVEDACRQVSRSEFPTGEDAQRVLNVFAEARLISVDQDTVEITHEALLRAWPRLGEWIETDRAGHLARQRLEDAAKTWDGDDRDPNLLYRGSRLHSAREWAATHPDQLSLITTEFLAAAVRQENRSKRLRQLVLATLSTLTLLAMGAAGIAFRERDNAVVSQIVAQADRLADTDVSVSAQLYLAAHDRQPDSHDLDNAVISAANRALSSSIPGTEEETVREVTISRDRQLLTTSGSNVMRLWDIADPTHPRPLAQLPPDLDDIVKTSAFGPDGRTMVTAGIRGMRLWNITDPVHPVPLTAESFGTVAVQAVAFSPDGHTLASADNLQKEVRLWDLTNVAHPTPLAVLPSGPGDIVSTVEFSSGRHTLVTAGVRGARLSNTTDPAHPTPLTPEDFGTGAVRAVALSPDGRTLASASTDQTVRLWDVSGPAHPIPIGRPLEHADTVNAVAFSPDGHTLASAGNDRTVRVWNVADAVHPTLLGRPLEHANAVNAVAFSPDGHTLVSAGPGQPVQMWSVPYVRLIGHSRPITAVAFSPDGRTLASAGTDRTVRLWNVAEPARPVPLGQALEHTNTVNTLAFSPDGHTLASAGWDQPVRLWNVVDPAHPAPLGQTLGDHSIVSAVAFSPDRRTLASAGAVGIVQLSDVADPAHPASLGQPLQHSQFVVTAVAFSADGHTLASAGNDKTVRLWDVTDPAHPAPIGQPLEHTNIINAVAFSPDGHTLASADDDKTVRLWDVTDPAHPAPIGQPLEHTNIINAVAFSPDGRTLASAGLEQPVRLWDVTDPAHPTLVGRPLGPANTTYALAFSPDGAVLASAGEDQMTWLWEVHLDQAIRRICAATSNTLTPEKWRQYVSPDLRYDSRCR
nr:WD40 repeat domain-containing protein [Pseudonocardia acaciae]